MRLLNAKSAMIVLALMPGIAAGVPAKAETRSLVVGIDKYIHGTSLHGAVADARDIHKTLKGIGVTDRTLLLDDQATKTAIWKKWNELVARSRKGDTIIFTYAGHGAQEPEVGDTRDEADGLDEVFLLGGFTEDISGNGERIVDDEIGAWFEEARLKGIQVIFVADSCHSGTMTRRIDKRVEVPERFSSYTVNDTFPPPKVQGPSPEEQGHVLFLAASQDDQKTPELPVEGKLRGVLSWSFARAVSGRADRNGDGIITRLELTDYILPTVRQMSESRQTPQALPRGVEDRGLIRIDGGPPEQKLKPVLFGITGGKIAVDLAERIARPIAGGERADLTVDLAKGQVLSGAGDVVAHKFSAEQFPALLTKWYFRKNALLMNANQMLSVKLEPGDNVYSAGERLQLVSPSRQFPFVLIFNVASDGELQLMYPLFASDKEKREGSEAIRIDLKAGPPFGADHFFVIASAAPLHRFRGLISRQGTRMTQELVDKLLEELKPAKFQLGIQAAYTREGT